jgi:probable rRNA maturation factor
MGVYAVSVEVLGEYDDLVSGEWLLGVAEQALAVQSQESGTRLSVIVTDDEVVRSLNKRHRGLDENTDVLAFSFNHQGHYYGEGEPPAAGQDLDFVLPPGDEGTLGEVIISYPQALRQAREGDIERELGVLVAHGVLHLLGLDHEDPADEAVMERITAEVLARARSPQK